MLTLLGGQNLHHSTALTTVPLYWKPWYIWYSVIKHQKYYQLTKVKKYIYFNAKHGNNSSIHYGKFISVAIKGL